MSDFELEAVGKTTVYIHICNDNTYRHLSEQEHAGGACNAGSDSTSSNTDKVELLEQITAGKKFMLQG